MSLKAEIKKEKDVVRRNHLKRQLLGIKGLSELVPDQYEATEKRNQLNEAVAAIGRKNRIEAEKQNQKNRLKRTAKVNSRKG